MFVLLLLLLNYTNAQRSLPRNACGVNRLSNYTRNEITTLYAENGKNLTQLIWEDLEGTNLDIMGYDAVNDMSMMDDAMSDMMEGNNFPYSCPVELSVQLLAPDKIENDPFLREGLEYEYMFNYNFTQSEGLQNILEDGAILVQVVASQAYVESGQSISRQFTDYIQLEKAESDNNDEVMYYYKSGIPFTVLFPEKNDNAPRSLNLFLTISVNVMFLAGNNSTDEVEQFLAIQGIMERSLQFMVQPYDLSITPYFTSLSTIAITAVTGVLLFFIFMVIRHRHNTVMRISQWPFLLIILLSSICATLSARFETPENDTTCHIGNSLTVIFSSFILTIVIGRLWRTSLLLSTIISIGGCEKCERRRKSLSRINDTLSYLIQWKELFVCITRPCVKQSRQSNLHFIKRSSVLRNKVSTEDLFRLVFILMLPIISMFLLFSISGDDFHSESVYEYDETGLYRKEVCSGKDTPVSILIIYVFYFAQQLFCTYMAYLTSDLPSLFNETTSIYRSILTSFISDVMITPLIILSDSPTISPEVSSLLVFINALILPVTMSWCLVYPKLKVIWSGEKIVVSKLLSSQSNTNSNVSNEVKDNDTNATYNGAKSSQPSNHSHLTNASHLDTNGNYHAGNLERNFVTIRENESKPSWLEHKMVSLQNLLSTINSTSLSGMTVSRRHWEELKELVITFGDEMEYVRFDWDEQQVDEAAR